MDKKSKIFFAVFFLLIAGSVAATYYKIMIQRDYIIQAEVDCDPYTETCFVYVCNPEAGEECTGDPAEDTSYYKLIQRNAKNIPSCDPSAEGCDALICPLGEAECALTLCDATTAKDGEVCNDPAAYAEDNPLESEDAAAADGTDGDAGTVDESLDTSQDGNSDVIGEPVPAGEATP
ncbi:MAG: hypothetical protein WAV46_04735 [Candidatus Moraniibacteriota bacterium]